MIQSWSSGSSSSGFGSSKESTGQNYKSSQKGYEDSSGSSKVQKSNGKLNDKGANIENSNNNVKNLPQHGLKSCDCQEHIAIESMVHSLPTSDLKHNKQPHFQQSNYSNIQNVMNNPTNAQIPTKRPPTPPRLSRKAVSFRSSVEHIGSPNYRRLRDAPQTLQSLFQPPLFGYSSKNNDNDDNDSCDSMHVTKDFSLVDNPNDDDYLLPRDCSTPKVNPENGEQLIQVEVHKPKNGIMQQQDKLLNGRKIQDYTCLCSADFNCTHNYAPLSTQQERFIDPNRYRDITRQQNPQYLMLSNDCSDCKNLSTYVNLSRQQVEPNQPSFYGNLNNLSVASSSDVNGTGYNSNEYRQLIKSKQSEVYGQTNVRQRQQNLSISNSSNEQRVAAATSNQANDYLSVARRLQLSMEDCEMCHRQLEQQSSDLMQCSCLPLGTDIITNNSRQSAEIETGDKSSSQLRNMSSSTTKSFHTASSSLNSIPTLNQSQQQAYINSSELSVLPLNATTTTTSSRRNDYIDLRRLESKADNHGETKVDSRSFEGNIEPPSSNTNSNNNNNNNNNIDSSLSSLFVYRHVSHNNTPEVDEGFDPDSLEIKQANCSNSNKSSNNNSWLKSRAKSEYIPLSSTNSTISATATTKPKARKQQQQHANTTGNYLTANKASKATCYDSSQQTMQLGTDITQSSLAKRRHLANSLQQNGKRKLLLSKSKSTPNVSQHNRSSSSSSSNVKNIYQCVKNHLFDTLTKSSSNSSSSKQMNGQQFDSNQQQAANNCSNSTLSSSSATLPANLNITSTKSSRTITNKSMVQVCM